jgi:hypothetical protein
MQGYVALAQRKAIRREFEEAIEDRSWNLAVRIYQANNDTDIFTEDDWQRAWKECHR